MMLIIVAVDAVDFARWLCSMRLGGLRRLLARFRGSLRREDEDPELLEEMAMLMSARRLQLGRTAMAVLRPCSCLFCLQLAVRVLLGLDLGYEFRVLAFMVGLMIVSACARFKAACLAARSMPILHLLCAVVFFSVILVEDPTRWTQLTLATDILMMLGLCCIYFHIRLVLVTNIAMSICVLIAFARCEEMQAGEALHQRIFAELFSLMGRITLVLVAQCGMEHSVRKEVEAQLGKCTQTAVSSLLDTLCDAVVELDEDLRLKSHFPKLANLLV
eukprot:CAMPEP_0170210898 /NCGR_PEP_ID=MMETSP0116_2-20130129/5061_1 /TAXON_ID=400756 /ORGANISM="Durinskia baltica, Strain CSIRO CS-38" /LENGTH=273 /DNA_ID=CAMNT_0010461425 /DNA_START=71 /DNA_END=888 /DNA_ORIENTATION=-